MQKRFLCAIVILMSFAQSGCSQVVRKVTQRPWHEKYDWKAEEFFEDPQVIALCHAIEANDLEEIDRLVAAGANVNLQGKRNMTPLLWAYPDNKLQRFKRILEHGADPNVVFDAGFDHPGYRFRGNSVTHMACGTYFPGYFEAVFENGGDPNLVKNGIISNRTPLFSVISGVAANRKEKVKTLIELRADIDHVDGTGVTPARMAVGWGAQYDIALLLLESGADHTIRRPDGLMRLVHNVVNAESRLPQLPPQHKADHQKLVKWLEDHGESLAEARADKKRWKSWSGTPAKKAVLRTAEIAEIEAKEEAEREAKKNDKRGSTTKGERQKNDKRTTKGDKSN